MKHDSIPGLAEGAPTEGGRSKIHLERFFLTSEARRFLPWLVVTVLGLGLIVGAGLSAESWTLTILTVVAAGFFGWQLRAFGSAGGWRGLSTAPVGSSDSKWHHLADAMPQMVWAAEPDGCIDYYNERWYEFTGAPRGLSGDRSWCEIIHPDDLAIVHETWYRAIATGEPFELELRIRDHKKGMHRWHLGRALPVRDENGRIVRWFGTSTDIDDQKRAEDGLRSSRERQNLALAAARLGNWEWDLKNDRISSLNGLSILFDRGEDQEFRNFADYLSIIHPDDQDMMRQAIERSLKLGDPQEIEYRVLWPDGSIHWLATRGAIFFDPDGTPAQMVGVSLDITERKNAEAQIRLLNESLERRVRERTVELAEANLALREGERRFRAIFDSTFELMGLLSPEGILLEANQTSLDFAGVGREEVIGRPFWETPWWAHSHEAREQLRRAISEAASGKFVRFETEHRSADGSMTFVDFSLKPMLDEDGKVALLIPEGRNITEQKQADEALRRSEAALRESHRLAGVGSWEWDPFRDLVTWSDELYRIAGRDPNLPAPTYAEHYELYSAASMARLDEAVACAFATGEPYEVELEIPGELGESRWLIGRGEIVRGADGELSMLRGTVQDITARTRIKDDLRRARDEAMAATQARSEFLANMSHEIRTPMNGVIGMTELLLMTELDEVQADYARTIRSSGEALLTVINDILDFSKIEAGKLRIEIVRFDLFELIKEVANLLGPYAQKKGLAIDRRVGPNVPPHLNGDPIRVRQILTNLAGNAVKFTDEGQVAIEAHVVDELEDRLTIRVEVHDTGIGIPKDRQSDIFESFTQVDAGSKRRHGGTGLGLTICRRLVELMGGRIGLESSPGKGSTFWFELNFGRETEDDRNSIDRAGPDPADRSTGSRPTDSIDPVFRSAGPAVGPRVLLVDDNAVNRRVAMGLLHRLGCSVETVENGREAIEALDYDRHDLIFMDVQMPEMDGFAATAAIREREKFSGRHIPIIAMTAHAMQGDSQKCLDAGMDGYLTKPIRASMVHQVILEFGTRPQADRQPPAQSNLENLSTLRQYLQDSCGEHPELLAEVLGMLVSTTDSHLDRLETAIVDGDHHRIAAEAHTLKGVFLTVGAGTLADVCRRLMEPGDPEHPHEVEETFQTIRQSWTTLRDETSLFLEFQRSSPEKTGEP